MKELRKPIHTDSPLYDFTWILSQYGPGWKYVPRILLYYFKFAAFEPFRILENWLYGRKVREHRLKEDPVFILGYYRSGTTHLQEVLLQDSQFGFLNFFQCYFQNGFLCTEKVCTWTFQKIMTAVEYHHPAHNLPFRFDMPGEEDVSMVASGFRLASNWGQLFPRHFKKIFNETVFFEGISENDRLLFEHEMQTLFKRVSLAGGGKRLLLKSPPQTGRLKMLLRLYPNAKFIFIRRNPYFVYQSNLKLWRSFNAQCLADTTLEETKENILWSFDQSLERYEVDKQSVPSNQLAEVAYEEFLKDPVGEVERIYRMLGLSGFSQSRPRMEAYLAKKHGTNIDRYTFSDEVYDAVESRWKKWLDLWGYQRPSGDSSLPLAQKP